MALSQEDYVAFCQWLQCYENPGMKNMKDHNGRTIWFKVGHHNIIKYHDQVIVVYTPQTSPDLSRQVIAKHIKSRVSVFIN